MKTLAFTIEEINGTWWVMLGEHPCISQPTRELAQRLAAESNVAAGYALIGTEEAALA
jgi:hypothetical protein